MCENTEVKLWAKLPRHGDNIYQRRHPVICHLLDVAAVAKQYYDTAICKAIKDRLITITGYTDTELRNHISFWAGSHDIGKINPGFQRKVFNDVLRSQIILELHAAGFVFPHYKEVPHGIVSSVILT